jgi:hypothetical protein
MRNTLRVLGVLVVACLSGGTPASAQAPQYHQYQPQYQPQLPQGAQPGTVYPGVPPSAGTPPYVPPRGPTGPVGRPPRGGTVSALTANECRNLGCSLREDRSCPNIVHDYHTRNWACQCAGGSSCINQSSPY